MIGVGVDMVSNQRMTRLIGSEAFVRRTFTKREIKASVLTPNKAEYFASRFAAKEATFKALAHFTKDMRFDMKIVESLRDEDGFPYIVVNEELRRLMEKANMSHLSLSISTEGDFSIAFVVAV